MDTGKGYMEQFTDKSKELEALKQKYPNHGGVFEVGEEIEIRGSRWRVKAIGKKEMRLRLLPKEL